MDEATVVPQVGARLAALSKAVICQCSHGLLQALPGCLTEIEEGGRDVMRNMYCGAEWSTLIGREGRDRALIGREL